MYHPSSAGSTPEWIEIYNQNAVRMDVSGWTIGGGINFTFPSGSIIPGEGYLVVAASPAALLAATGYSGALGPFTGALSNGGDDLKLINSAGRVMDELNYGDGKDWPVGPDGSGATLAKRDPQTASAIASNWSSSARIGGTPGAANQSSAVTQPVAIPSLFSTGLSAGGAQLSAGQSDPHWTTTSTGVALIAQTPHPNWAPNSATSQWVGTVVNGATNFPAGNYSYTTHFDLTGRDPSTALVNFKVAVDDNLRDVLLNGVSVGMATNGFGALSSTFTITKGFVGGDNRLEFRFSNASGPTGLRVEMSGTANLTGTGASPATLPKLAFNEIDVGGSASFFVELANNDTSSIDLAGMKIVSSSGGKYTFGAQSLGAGQLLSVNKQALGFAPAGGDKLYLYTADGAGLIDAAAIASAGRGIASQRDGVWQFTSAATPGAANAFSLTDSIVINEIMYDHAPVVTAPATTLTPSPEEWIELYNRSSSSINLSGWTLSDAVDFSFPQGTTIPAGGYLVIARDGASLHATFPSATIAGSFSGTLSDSDDNILLLDGVGNIADQVHYRDSDPWPSTADGGGSSLELRDPFSDNSNPQAWAASVEPASAPWQTITYTGAASEPAGVSYNELYNEFVMGLLDSGSVMIDDVSVIENPTTSPRQVIQNGGFENGGGTADKWRIMGSNSGQVVTDPGNAANHVLLLTSTSPTDYASNHAETTFKAGGTFVPINNGGQYQISLRAKWISGSPQLNTRLYLNRLAQTTILPTVAARGTPGAANSTRVANAGPTYSDLRQGSSTTLTSGLTLVQEGGTFSTNDLAQGRPAFALNIESQDAATPAGSNQPTGYSGLHTTVGVNDGSYGNMGGWIAGSDGSFVGINLGATLVQVSSLAFGRDNNGVYTDRSDSRTYTIQYTTAANPNNATAAGSWTTIGTLPYNLGLTIVQPALRHRFDFAPVMATGVRIVCSSGTLIDEFELYANHLTDSSATTIRPGAGQSVTISVNAADPQGITSMVLKYSVNGGSFADVLMTTAGGGVYQGTIPGQVSGAVVQFYVQGTDGSGATSTYPADGPASRALYKVGLPNIASTLHGFQIIMTPADAAALNAPQNLMSRGRLGATVLYDDEVYYDVGIRLKGSQVGIADARRRGYNVLFQSDHLFRGAAASIGFDRSGDWKTGGPTGQDEIIVNLINGRIGGLPGMANDLAYLDAPGVTSGNAILQMDGFDDGDFLKSSGHDGSTVFSYDVIYDPNLSNSNDPESTKIALETSIAQVPLGTLGTGSKEAYRLNYAIQNNRDADDYSGLIRLANLASTSGATFLQQAPQVIDVDEWLRYFAFAALINPGDHWATNTLNHNVKFLTDPTTGKVQVLPWDMDFVFVNATNAPLSQNAILDKLLQSPQNVHYFQGALQDMLATTYNNAYLDGWISYFQSLLPGQDFSSYKGYVTSRASFVQSQLAASTTFRITTNGGQNFSVATNSVTLQGAGWINVHDIRLAGSGTNLAITWPTTTTWQVTLPLNVGANPISLQAYDVHGNPLSSASITVTSSASAPPPLSFLRVSELDYNPTPVDPLLSEVSPTNSAQDFEFVEFVNTGTQALTLTGVKFTNGINFDFTGSSITSLAPGARVVVVKNLAAFQSRYGTGFPVAGVYTGALDNAGEEVAVADPSNVTLIDFTYDNSGDWPGRADGKGSSLEAIDTSGDYNAPANWRSSSEFGGTPGAAGAGPVSSVVVNEVLSNSSAPLTDSIELFNPTAAAISIGGWYLSDSSDNYRKFQIPSGTILSAGGYLVYTEADFNPTNGTGPNDFALDGAHGDEVYLMSADPTTHRLKSFIDHPEFGPAADGESFGRWPNGVGSLYPMVSRSFGAANPGPRVGPVVISQVMYDPAGSEADPSKDSLEFIQIYNPAATTVDVSNWTLANAVTMTFAAGTTIAGHGLIVAVPFNPVTDTAKTTAFRSAYGIGASVTLVGPYAPSLSNTGGQVELRRPDVPPADDPTFIPQVLVDEVAYGVTAPWPASAKGGGDSIHRSSPTVFGDFGQNWTAGAPTPGFAFATTVSTVVNRRIFYNDSFFDGNDVAANPSDDVAIATDKSALLPGGHATFANVSAYDKGISGVMMDIAGLPVSAALTSEDFTVEVGTDGVNWTSGPTPTSVTLRAGAGDNGSTRVTFTWSDNAIKNKWLRLTMNTTAATGLATPDVSYWGSAVGDTGNVLVTDTIVNIDSADYYGVRDHLRSYDNPNPVTWNWDINRDSITDITDVMLVRASAMTPTTALKLITAPQPPAPVQSTTGNSSTEKTTTGQTTTTTTTPVPTSTPSAPIRPPVKLLSPRSRISARPLLHGARSSVRKAPELSLRSGLTP